MEREEMEGLEQKLPDTRDSGLMYTIAAILFVFVGSRLARLGMPTGLYIIVSEVLIIALPPIVLARMKRLSIVPTFCLKKPRAVEILLTVMISPVMIIAGACAGLIALITIKNTFGSLQLNTGVTSVMSGGGVLWSLFLIAVVPAVCEELLFRGLIQRGLERMGAGWSIFLSGLLFGLFHFDFQRFAAQTLIGVIAAYLVYRTGSIINGMILHFLNNGLITLLVHSSTSGIQQPNPMPQPSVDPFSSPEFLKLAERYGMSLSELLNSMIIPIAIIFVVCLVVIFGLLLVVRSVTRNRVELPVRDEKAGRGLLLGIPGVALVLMVYTAIGLELLKNPAGPQILRFLGL
ncbi:MAG: CPBP family intramembrane metalloprotease [Clostridiaceae bacterium]|jgi:membrane protease YdiL (CAAX protease family)|nr:CPBP family intramembrane metalloprotease [Clostridiaceae bacterium]